MSFYTALGKNIALSNMCKNECISYFQNNEYLMLIRAQHDPETEKRPDCTPEDKNINGRFLMSKVRQFCYGNRK